MHTTSVERKRNSSLIRKFALLLLAIAALITPLGCKPLVLSQHTDPATPLRSPADAPPSPVVPATNTPPSPVVPAIDTPPSPVADAPPSPVVPATDTPPSPVVPATDAPPSPVADAPPSPVVTSPVVIERIQIDPRNRADAVWGIRVSFQHRWTAIPEGSSGAVNVRFATTDGRPVRATVDSSALRDRQGQLRVRAQTYATGDSVAFADFFIPFFAMDLPTGPQELVLIFEAGRSRGYQGMISHPLALQPPPPSFVIVKPPTRTITLLVSRVEVQPGSYDATLFRPHKGRPDLRWQVRFGTHPGAVVYSSRIHRDTFRTEWNRATPAFQWSEGDRLSIDVFDNDIAADDLLACFSFTYEQLHLAATQGRPLSRGAVRQMSLEVMIRE